MTFFRFDCYKDFIEFSCGSTELILLEDSELDLEIDDDSELNNLLFSRSCYSFFSSLTCPKFCSYFSYLDLSIYGRALFLLFFMFYSSLSLSNPKHRIRVLFFFIPKL